MATLSTPGPTSREERELIAPDSPLAPYVSVNPGRLSGAPCFKDTRVPVQTLFDYLGAGDSLDEFLDGFPNVKREDAVAVLKLARMALLQGLSNL
ncbi:MAG: DUF433 domain-containing protein [Planctomycetes bacterium]|nr:DUF433 domain-containing protein [Planctomycetota bacterium]